MHSDEELIQKIGQGDTQSFATFFDRHAPRLSTMLQSILRNKQDADDVLQETFHQLWRTASAYNQQRGSPTVWLMMIARSRAVDLLRKHSRELKAKSSIQYQSGHNDASVTHTDQIVHSEDVSRLHNALQQLPKEQSDLVKLSFLEGKNHFQISELMKLPLGTVKTRIRRGIIKLRDILGNSEVNDS